MKITPRKSELLNLDLTPMIDVTFQLISFFMMVTNFEQTQADERVKLPKDTLARPNTVKRDHELVINVGFIRDAKGNKEVPDALVFYGGDRIPVLSFEAKLKKEAHFFSEAKVKLEDVTVLIRADNEVPAGLVQELIKYSQSSGFSKFALRAFTEASK